MSRIHGLIGSVTCRACRELIAPVLAEEPFRDGRAWVACACRRVVFDPRVGAGVGA